MKIELVGRVALVSGAVRNIGRAIAANLAAAGASVACTYHESANEAEATAATIAQQTGANIIACRLDQRDPASIRAAVAEVGTRLGPIDILVNNAATRPRAKIEAVTPEDWDLVLETNLRGPFFLAQAVIPGMRARNWGRIVNVSGVDAYWGNPQRPHNVAAKTGLIGLSRALANECARWGITVNTLVPGAISTERRDAAHYPNLPELEAARLGRVPAARLGNVQDLANAATFLCSEQANYVTGQELLVTGGAFPMVRQKEVEY